MNNRYMLTDKPLLINRELACAIGLNNSIVLRQILYWMDYHKEADHQDNHHEGKWWVYNSYPKWKKDNFPFWNIDTIRAAIWELEELELILSGNFNKRSGDNTKWYTINWPVYDVFMSVWKKHESPACGNGKKSGVYRAFIEDYVATLENWKSTPPLVIVSLTPYDTFIGQLGNNHRPLPEITQESNTEENTLPATQDVVSKKRQPKTPKPIHPLNQKDDTGQNPYFNLVLQYSFTANPNSKADSNGIGGRVGKVLAKLIPLYDELGGFTPAELEAAYQRLRQDKGSYMATDAEKVYGQLSPYLRRLVTENNTVPAAPVVKPRPDITPRVGTRRLDALQPLMPRKDG